MHGPFVSRNALRSLLSANHRRALLLARLRCVLAACCGSSGLLELMPQPRRTVTTVHGSSGHLSVTSWLVAADAS